MSTIRRTLAALLSILASILAVSVVLDLVPGDPIDMLLGEQAIDTDRAALRAALGLDQSLPRRMATFLLQTVTLTLRSSVPPFTAPVFPRIFTVYPNTLALASGAVALALPMALALGLALVVPRGRAVPRVVSAWTIVAATLPVVWTAPLLIWLVAIRLDWTPVSGFETPVALILPAASLALGMSAALARVLRTALLDTAREDHVRTARALGLPPRRVLRHSILRNALSPFVAVLGLQLGALLGGSIIIEKIFSFPGLGSFLLLAIGQRDYNAVRAAVLVLTVSFIVVNWCTDLVLWRLDPRTRR